MRKITLLVFISISVFSQNDRDTDSILFSEMLGVHHTEYQQKSSLDFHRGKLEDSEDYFRSLVNSKLKGTILDNFRVFSLDNKISFLYDLENPIYLMSYASWCVPSNGELEALRLLIDEHSSWMDFVLILWDKKEDALKFSKQFHPKTKVLYVNELYNVETKTVKMLKHKLGVPVSLTISSNKIILNIRKNTQIHPSVDVDKATQTCYDDIYEDIGLLKAFENL